MPLSMHQASTPVFLRGLTVLSNLLAIGRTHAVDAGIDPARLLEARLAPDMMPLVAQIQRASDASKFTVARLTGVAAPAFDDRETTFDELQARIDATRAYIASVPAAAFEGSERREVVIKAGTFEKTFRGEDYLLGFALPNFYFHVTTAYGILRAQGVALGKRDFLGALD